MISCLSNLSGHGVFYKLSSYSTFIIQFLLKLDKYFLISQNLEIVR